MKSTVRVMVALVLLIAAQLPVIAQETPAQRESAKRDAAAFAVYLSQLEAAGGYSELYDLMHPDAKAIIPKSAVVGWYQNSFGPRGPQPSTITLVLLVPWQWGVNGAVYFDAAELQYTQTFADGSVDNSTMHLALDSQGQWRWFFGGSWDFVQSQIALYPEELAKAAPTPKTATIRPASSSSTSKPAVSSSRPSASVAVPREALDAYREVEEVWIELFIDDSAYRSPNMKQLAIPGESACGPLEEDPGPFYCPADETIYLTPETWNHFGGDEFLFGVVVAHEWGHHIQNIFGMQKSALPMYVGQYYSLEMELAADCLAGVWAVAEAGQGEATILDLIDAFEMMTNYGDAEGSPLTAPDAHGSGEQRAGAFDVGATYGSPTLCVEQYMGG